MNALLIIGAVWGIICTCIAFLWWFFDKGKESQKAKSDETSLKEIRLANDARRAVTDSPDSLRRDKYNRDNGL